jgi:hypothetical protein
MGRMSFFEGAMTVRVGVVLLTLGANLLLCPGRSIAQQGNTSTGANPLALPPAEWAKLAADNEIKIVRYHSPYLRYRIHQVGSKGDQVRDVIESKDGAVARLVERSGKPLTKQQDDAERSRLQDMLNSPQAFARHMKEDQDGKQTAIEMLTLLPQAMIYSYAPGQPQRAGAPAHSDARQEVVLDFKPNQQWKAPTLKAEALSGLNGRLWIDPQAQVVTRMEGRIFQPINVGWGMLAHVYPGGTLEMEQIALPGHRFIASHFVEDVTVRAILVKTLKVHTDMNASAFTTVPELSYRQAVQTLLDTPLVTAD